MACASFSICDGFVVAQAREGRPNRFELRDVALKDLQVRRAALRVRGSTMKLRKFSASAIRPSRPAVGDLRLDHPELGQVAAGLGFLRAEGRPEAVDLAQGQRSALDVELAALGEEGFVAEVVDRKERRWCLRRLPA